MIIDCETVPRAIVAFARIQKLLLYVGSINGLVVEYYTDEKPEP